MYGVSRFKHFRTLGPRAHGLGLEIFWFTLYVLGVVKG